MSYLVAGPEYLSAAANSLAGIGSTLGEANAAAAASTTDIRPCARRGVEGCDGAV
ncbi:PE family protein [Mycobacterium kansasii]|uniref:PE family protein n=1 Tax=Mycobacterium kansasii TaxID=1768 RepID=A0A1V3W921_MYCKA|nr:PE family protein [Mycobacterium kansasii]